jgi:hypothetical protein
MPMASQDPLPQAIDFLSQCERCHTMVGDLWLFNGEYICGECYLEKPITKNYNYQKIEIQYKNVVQKNIYGWTKWYGANNNLFTITQEWTCQACGEKQTNELPSYLIRIKDSEYARICSICLHVALEKKINNIFRLMKIMRKYHPDF